MKIARNTKKVRTVNSLPSKTQQQFKQDADINNIISKYAKTGQITHLSKKKGSYVDLSAISDYQTSLQTVIDANSAFNSLSSQIRHRFANDPSMLLSFLQDPSNMEEGIKLGLLERPKTAAPAAPATPAAPIPEPIQK